MAKPRTNLSRQATQGYWAEVRGKLQRDHGLDRSAADEAVARYRGAVDEADVGDLIYHAPIDETARGIVDGGYADGDQGSPPGATSRRV